MNSRKPVSPKLLASTPPPRAWPQARRISNANTCPPTGWLRGNSGHGWVDVVYGEVVRIHVKNDALTAQGKLNYAAIRPLARMGYYDYTSVTETFEMRIPGATGSAADGLEGKA